MDAVRLKITILNFLPQNRFSARATVCGIFIVRFGLYKSQSSALSHKEVLSGASESGGRSRSMKPWELQCKAEGRHSIQPKEVVSRGCRQKSGNANLFGKAMALHPTGRVGTQHELANAGVFLTSPIASSITVNNLVVDGSLTRGAQLQVRLLECKLASMLRIHI